MTIEAGAIFRLAASPDPEVQRILAYLATIDSGSVLTDGFRRATTNYGGTTTVDTVDVVLIMLQSVRLADPAYQAAAAQISTDIDIMDEASVQALQEIEEELRRQQRDRVRMRELAYRNEQGRFIFMTEDGTAAYYEDGMRLAEEDFVPVKQQLHATTKWDAWRASAAMNDRLLAEREQIHLHETARDQLRDDLAKGAISKDEAERRAQEIVESQPERVRRAYDAAKGATADTNAVPDTSLSADEEANLNAFSDSTPAGSYFHHRPPSGPS